MSLKPLALALIFLFTQFATAQTIEPKNSTEDKAKLEKEAVVFLRETLGDVGGMRSLENRISFTAELAGLMWFHDEREAKAMFTSVSDDFRQLLLQYDAQMNSLSLQPDGESQGYSGGFLGGDLSGRGRISRKFTAAMALRQQIAMSMAEHDADLAYSFYSDSLVAITNADFRKQIENGSNARFETQLISQIAQTNASKATEYGLKSLDKGVSYHHVELLKKIYAKDPDKAADFGAAVLAQLKKQKYDSADYHYLSSLFSFGAETLDRSKKPNGKRAVFTQQQLSDLADAFAQAILAGGDGLLSFTTDDIEYEASMIGKFAPARAAQIRAKYKTNASPTVTVSSDIRGGQSNGQEIADAAIAASDPARAESERDAKRLGEEVMKIGSRQLPRGERDRVIAEARRTIALISARDQKITAISMLAAQVAQAGDKELAAEIMKDAASLVNPSPKNYQDFLLTWVLASGYAAADPDKAFPLLEDTIGRANETIAAFVKAGEFFDVGEEMIQDGEVQFGAFGGGMVRGLTGELGMADSTIQLLAKADFTKTKNLTNRFDRPEVRVLAKMMVIRAILGPGQKANPQGDVLSDLPAGTKLDEK